MARSTPKGTGRRPGPKPRWGERSPVSVSFPKPHRQAYEAAAAELGISLNEYLIRVLAAQHGLLPNEEEITQQQQQLPLGA